MSIENPGRKREDPNDPEKKPFNKSGGEQKNQQIHPQEKILPVPQKEQKLNEPIITLDIHQFDSEILPEEAPERIATQFQDIVAISFEKHLDCITPYTDEARSIEELQLLHTTMNGERVEIYISQITRDKTENRSITINNFFAPEPESHTYFIDSDGRIQRVDTYLRIQDNIPQRGAIPTRERYTRLERRAKEIRQIKETEQSLGYANTSVGETEIQYLAQLLEEAEIMPVSLDELATIYHLRQQGGKPIIEDSQKAGILFTQQIQRFLERQGYDLVTSQDIEYETMITNQQEEIMTITIVNDTTPTVSVTYEYPLTEEEIINIVKPEEMIDPEDTGLNQEVFQYEVGLGGRFITTRTQTISYQGEPIAELDLTDTIRADTAEAEALNHFLYNPQFHN
jgi:hypothetical protein